MSTSTQTVATEDTRAAARRHKRELSEGKRAERRLGWLLCAPAVIVMIAVTAYPIAYAIYLSLERYDLRFPSQAKFIGLSNYAAVLSSPYWWQALKVTAIITVISVAIELVLGMLLAMLMHRTLFGRGTVRTSILIPYGIVTVAAAFSWQYAWTPNEGYLSALFNNSAPLTKTVAAIAIIILAEVWKTTPFMALLLLAGLSLVPEDLQQGGQGGRGDRVAALRADHAAADEAGDSGGVALPYTRRVQDLRQHLHPDAGWQQHLLGLDSWL